MEIQVIVVEIWSDSEAFRFTKVVVVAEEGCRWMMDVPRRRSFSAAAVATQGWK